MSPRSWRWTGRAKRYMVYVNCASAFSFGMYGARLGVDVSAIVAGWTALFLTAILLLYAVGFFNPDREAGG